MDIIYENCNNNGQCVVGLTILGKITMCMCEFSVLGINLNCWWTLVCARFLLSNKERDMRREMYLALAIEQVNNSLINKWKMNFPCFKYILVSRIMIYYIVRRSPRFLPLLSRFFSGVAWIVGDRLVAVTHPQAFSFFLESWTWVAG